jgi:hypothetical protein
MITKKIGATHGFDANRVFCPTNEVFVSILYEVF